MKCNLPKIPIKTLLHARDAFAPHYNDPITPKLSYKIMKFCKAAEIEDDFYRDKLRTLLESYAEKDQTGNIVLEGDKPKMQEGKSRDEFEAKVQELNQTEVDKPTQTFTLDELGELKLSVVAMSNLEAFLEL